MSISKKNIVPIYPKIVQYIILNYNYCKTYPFEIIYITSVFKYTLSFDMYICVKLKIYSVYLDKLLSFQELSVFPICQCIEILFSNYYFYVNKII